ncbi:4-hydroxythreonine-4-phosphate dehydrogenase PdxA [Chitinimonas sp. BJB300]|uniref:4-hydroxythreonine-4-phosphate dehydrogenase PdxA n=1 Tax=Chitinimonas sp. BJB300 TaxID=1559339 RepID=UPI000C100EF7|nr:4-hydroxythreonine-4-phosphate dehydrogenase PdxA [Chitinimonas sp. BJB300]PHV12379.1 4-hydroxythreonine-4-phosphate dehydrogenase PdxA [Chitinimonas sp. BJB300]TSJ91089.1 4-hydroxythreonine-4-phosphate dehydrogenase PdxA [Chitinimonas sp. BJB300]
MSKRPIIAITCGEPAGVGPELAAALNPANHAARLVLLGDRHLLTDRAACVPAVARLCDYDPTTTPPPGYLEVLHIPLAVPCVAGRLDTRNAMHVLALLDRAVAGCQSGEFSAMVTAPLHKGVIRDAGYGHFTGHTEYLAEQTGTAQVVMLLAGQCNMVAPGYALRVALATTHLPLREVADAITAASLTQTLRILHVDLIGKFGLPQPRILVAGLNPHAGEGGHMGREELDVIIPVLESLRKECMQLIGPLPADTLFNPPVLVQADAVLAMYHDQGLPVLKHATFGQGVNITLGLPLIRTSVDHGTALDLAGMGKADGGSLIAAVTLAASLAR